MRFTPATSPIQNTFEICVCAGIIQENRFFASKDSWQCFCKGCYLHKMLYCSTQPVQYSLKGVVQMARLRTYLEFRIDGKRLPREETRLQYHVLFEVENFLVGLPIGSEVSLQIEGDSVLAWGEIYNYATESGRYLVVRIDTKDMHHSYLHTLLNGTTEVTLRVNQGPSPQHCLYPHVIDFTTGKMITVANWR